jgi:rhamnose utilization protein RhaD (predicted bifunctional aldolase and dehydrogenase)
MSKDIDWETCDGIILHNHGIFTFDNDAKKAYDKMIDAVTLAEEFLEDNSNVVINKQVSKELIELEALKKEIEASKKHEVFLKVNTSEVAVFYSNQDNLKESACKGVLTPEHIIRTKRVPLVIQADNISEEIAKYKAEYIKYFNTYKKDEICLNETPNYAVVKGYGIICFGKNEKEANIINDIISHTMLAVLRANDLGGYQSISMKDSFEMEYWELEQAKLKK